MSTALVPWFAWGMLPLTLSMVLANALLAHSRFSVVPLLVAMAMGYGVTLFLELNLGHGELQSRDSNTRHLQHADARGLRVVHMGKQTQSPLVAE